MKKILLITFCFVLGCSTFLYAQDNVQKSNIVNLKLSAMSYGDSIVLRWGYERSSAWRTLNENGFILERLSLDENNQVEDEAFQKLTADPIKPWPLDKWESAGITDNNYALIAAQSLYGKSFELSAASSQVEFMQDKANEAQNRFSFAMFAADISPVAANGLGLRYVDKDIDPDKKYIYRLYSPHSPAFFSTDTILYVINAADVYKPLPPKGLQAVEGDREVILSWSKENKYSAYYLQKSADGGSTFQNVNEFPYVQLSEGREPLRKYTYTDSLGKNYVPYHYRISGITAFGDLSPWSETLKVKGRDRTPPPAPVIREIENPSGSRVTIEWDVPEVTPDLKGFFVGKSSNVGGPFKPLNKEALPPRTRSYSDESIDIDGRNYYVVVSVDTAKNVSNSMPVYITIYDSIPPARPKGLAGTIDTSGVVKIHWPRGPEPDLQGYRVYASNSPERVLSPLSKGIIQDTAFTDTITLNTLNEKIYYSIVAVDWNHNNSPYSERLILQKPDTVPPVAPVIRDYKVEEKKITINWVPSSSKDVSQHVIFRKEGNKTWKEYDRIENMQQTTFIDTNVNRQEYYTYTIQALDDAGLHSVRCAPVRIRTYDSGVRDDVSGFEATYSADEEIVLLSWDYPETENCRFILYRSHNGGGLTMYQSVDGKIHEYSDRGISRPGVYHYALKAVYPDGGKSSLSDKIEVEVNNIE